MDLVISKNNKRKMLDTEKIVFTTNDEGLIDVFFLPCIHFFIIGYTIQ